MSKISGIYVIRNTVNDKSYVGSSKHVHNRWSVHRQRLRAGDHHSPKLQNAWNKNGEASFAFEIIEAVEDLTKLIEREQFHMDRLGATTRHGGYNIAKNAGSPLGFKHKPEQGRKISAFHKGKPKSPAHCRAISEARKGIPFSPLALQKAADLKRAGAALRAMSRPPKPAKGPMCVKGSKRSPETIEKIRAAALRRWANR